MPCQWEMFFVILHISLIIYQEELAFLLCQEPTSSELSVTLQSFSKSLLSRMQPHKNVKLVYMDYSLQYSSRIEGITHINWLLTDYEQQESLCITDLLIQPFYFSSALLSNFLDWEALKGCSRILLSSRIWNNSYSSPLPFSASFTFTWNCYFFAMCVQTRF